MIELTIHGRGGRGGVTLAKLIAAAYFRQGKHVQAFGVYGAERTGAPVQAYVRVDDREITVDNAIVHPDHVVVVDRSLLAPLVASGMKAGGWVVVNTAEPPAALAGLLPGRNVATVDANAIAIAHGLGTVALPIVNTALLGAVARVLALDLGAVEGALAHAGFAGPNTEAAREAFRRVALAAEPGVVADLPAAPPHSPLDFLDDGVGARPSTHTGTWASSRPHAHLLKALCGESCPAGNDVRGFVQAAADGDYDRALAVVLETSPFPATCGRVCPAPCMDACNRRRLDGAVDVRDIERAVAERGRRRRQTAPHRTQRVAVVGSGPAGLSAAYQLARGGYPVTVFEAGEELGGVLRTGIPEYRLPRAVLDGEIEFILRCGVRARTGRRIDRAALEELAHRYAAVFVATGLQTLRTLELRGAAGGMVQQGLEFLDAARRGGEDLSDKTVVVAGGGNTAMDAARTALRLGAHKVRVVYRRTRAEMPAIADEIEEALEEGVVIDELLSPVGLRRHGGHTTVVCRRMRLGEPDESGRPRALPLDGRHALAELRCDRLLLAVGQGSDLSLLPSQTGVSGGPLRLDETSAPVFTGGDLAGGEGTVTAAVGSGRRAAQAIAAVLSGAKQADAAAGKQAGAGVSAGLAGPEVLHLQSFSQVARERVAVLPPRLRRRSFAEVRLGLAALGHDAVRAEARRCFGCGVCTGCDVCVSYCPEGVLHRAAGQMPDFDYDYCKGCGLCASACPRGVVFTEAV